MFQKKLNFDPKFLIQVQSSKPINTKMPNFSEDSLSVTKPPSFSTNRSQKNAGTRRLYSEDNLGSLKYRSERGKRLAQHFGRIFHHIKVRKKTARKVSIQAGLRRIRELEGFFYDNPFGNNWCTLLQISASNFLCLWCFASLENQGGNAFKA